MRNRGAPSEEEGPRCGRVGSRREQILQALRQGEAGTPVVEICRKLGVTEQTFYRWRRKFGGLEASEVREPKQLRDENRRLKQLVADRLTFGVKRLTTLLHREGRLVNHKRVYRVYREEGLQLRPRRKRHLEP